MRLGMRWAKDAVNRILDGEGISKGGGTCMKVNSCASRNVYGNGNALQSF